MGVAAAKVTDCLLIIIAATYPSPRRYAKKQNPFVIIIEVTWFTIVWHLYFRHTEMVYHTHHQSAIILPALSRIFFQNICCPLFPHFPCSLFPYIDDLNSVAKTVFSEPLLCFFIWHMRESIWILLFYFWHISFNMISSSFMQVVAKHKV